MLFNSDVFLQFFAAFLLLYYLVRQNLAARNLLIVLSSYVFYGWWDYRLLSLLLASSLLDYGVGLGLTGSQTGRRRRVWLALSLVGNLGMLGFFKYWGFFVESLAALLQQCGLYPSLPTLKIILPVGISFYTFQSMSYALDVYRGQMPATRNLINFLAYVSFFPQLVAGPIERATHLLPQLERPRAITREMLGEGVWLILWGMFKKVALADNLAPLVEMVYQSSTDSGPLVILGTLAFGVQIYCDFSGYSDVARGLALVLGFDIIVNFKLPYLSANLREFWRRWHISFSRWILDYIFMPLQMKWRERPRAGTAGALLITFLISGLWHGAAWNFVCWGLWHGAGLVAQQWWSSWRGPRGARRSGTSTPPRTARTAWAATAASWALTMTFVFYGWLLFRADSLGQAASLTRALGHWSYPAWFGSGLFYLALYTLPLLLMQIWQAVTGDTLAPRRLPWWARCLLQGGLLVGILLYWRRDSTPFIYFQF